MRSRAVRSVLPVALILALVSCAPKTIQTPEAKRAYTALQVLQRIDELQNAVIAGNQQGIIPDATAVTIVRFTVATAKTLKAAPDGWQATVKTGWTATKAAIPAADAKKLQPYLDAVDLVLGLIGG